MPNNSVLLVDDSHVIINVLKHIAVRAGLVPVIAHCMKDAMVLCNSNHDNSLFCAIVDYHLPDAHDGEAIDAVLACGIPTIVITGQMTSLVRDNILKRSIVDYIPKENIQIYGYLKQLLVRLQSNHECGILLVSDSIQTQDSQIGRLLKRHYFNLHLADSAEAALKHLKRKHDIRVVLVGSSVGEKEALSIVVDARCDYSLDDLIIIGISKAHDAGLAARFVKSGANDYLSEPLCPETLFCRLYQNLERLEHLKLVQDYANTDSLTQLHNRRFFFDSLESYDFEAESIYAMAIIDIDHFKTVNDQYGHQAGDELLKQFSQLLKNTFSSFLVARVGGEEFCLFLPGMDEIQCRKVLSLFLQNVCSGLFPIGDNEINITISIGVAITTIAKQNELYRLADQALYQAKNQGRNQLRTYLTDDLL